MIKYIQSDKNNIQIKTILTKYMNQKKTYIKEIYINKRHIQSGNIYKKINYI